MSYQDAITALRGVDWQARAAVEAVRALEYQRALLAVRVEVLQALLNGQPVPIPVPPAEPGVPVPVPPVAGPDTPFFHSLPFYALMPKWTPYEVPTEADCDWIIAAGKARHVESGLEMAFTLADGVIGECYRHSQAMGNLDGALVVGVMDNAGPAVVGGQWSPDNPRSVVHRKDGQFGSARLKVVGLTPDAEVGLQWSAAYGYAAEVGAFNIGLRGGQNSMVILANDPSGHITLDGCWLLAHPGVFHEHGIHTDEWERLVIRRMKDKGFKAQQHILYPKSSRGEIWIVDNEFQGGNRTGVQIRPGRDDAGNPRPAGPVVIYGNRSQSWAWDHANLDGGGVISVYASPDAPVFIGANSILDPRGAGIVVEGQAPERNWLNAAGYPIGEVYLAANRVLGSRSDRAQVSIGGAQRVHWWASNTVEMAAEFDSQWGMEKHGIRNGEVRFYGDPREHAPRLRMWDGQRVAAMTDEQVEERMAQAGIA